jgi:serine O-acetyltransferase
MNRVPTKPAILAYEHSGGWGIDSIVTQLRAAREAWRLAQHRTSEFSVREFPSRDALSSIAKALCAALFPMRLGPSDLLHEGEDFYVGHTLDHALNGLFHQIQLELGYQRRLKGQDRERVEYDAVEIIKNFAGQLPRLRRLLDTDVEAAYFGDPAARSVDEVLLCYPGIIAIIYHRLAHQLHQLGAPLTARILAEIAHCATGIDIHPGAQIGEAFFIDHGTGVVIGETTVIGRQVRLYQAVTLGARSFEQEPNGALAKGGARHPILEDRVIVYAGASLLGRITIGQGSIIGGNVWLTRSVPPGSRISQASLKHEATHAKEGHDV